VLNRFTAPGLGSLLKRGSIYGAGAAAAEYGIEKLQDATPLWVQDAVAALKTDVPAADWSGFELFDQRTFLAVLPLSLLGAGVDTVTNARTAAELIGDSGLLRAVGFSQDQITA